MFGFSSWWKFILALYWVMCMHCSWLFHSAAWPRKRVLSVEIFTCLLWKVVGENTSFWEKNCGLLVWFPYISGVSSCFITFVVLPLMQEEGWREDTKVSVLVSIPRETRGSCLCKIRIKYFEGLLPNISVFCVLVFMPFTTRDTGQV